MSAVKSRQIGWLIGSAAFVGCLLGWRLEAASLDRARDLLRQGEYDDCIRECQVLLRDDSGSGEDAYLLLLRAQSTLGQYDEAWQSLQDGLDDTRRQSVRLLEAGREVARFAGFSRLVPEYVETVNRLAGDRSWAYRDPENLVALGRIALALGEEPRLVLEFFFDPGRQADPPVREAIMAAGVLALEKQDYKVASEVFREGVDKLGEDADFFYGLALAFAGSDAEEMAAMIERALTVNPKHIPSLLLQASKAIDAEQFELAKEIVDRALDINRWQPEAWVLRAVMAHLDGDFAGERQAREQGLKHWTTNPAVDHLIGYHLSRKYRFQEGAEYQRAALKFEPDHARAQLQLAQDLLRLGEEEEGWQWVERSHEQDGYNQTAFNLLTLKRTLDEYAVLEDEDFILRLPADEAPIFGDQVLALLNEAKDVLSEKYGIELERRIVLELFGHQQDFAVRTFGMPHNPGFLGVCFGNVITANSPSTQAGSPSNWRAVVWHEFCHVITLTMTRNRMPRWLSEGISVHEEIEWNASWGQAMTPAYRRRILDDGLMPLSQMSAAFMNAESNEDMQFAYYQSMLAVRYLVETWGMEALKGLLRDLGEGRSTAEALAVNMGALAELDAGFIEWSQDQARELGAGLDWNEPAESLDGAGAEEALSFAPNNYYLLLGYAEELMEERRWEEALAPLEQILASYPLQPGNREAPRMLVRCLRELERTDEELRWLKDIAQNDHEALDVYLRLIATGIETEDWELAQANLERFFAIDPLRPQVFRYQAKVSEALGNQDRAVDAWGKLLLLDPPDPARVHYQLARLLFETGRDGARHHVLRALEEAPRFRDAYRLLRLIKGRDRIPEVEPVAAEISADG